MGSRKKAEGRETRAQEDVRELAFVHFLPFWSSLMTCGQTFPVGRTACPYLASSPLCLPQEPQYPSAHSPTASPLFLSTQDRVQRPQTKTKGSRLNSCEDPKKLFPNQKIWQPPLIAKS